MNSDAIFAVYYVIITGLQLSVTLDYFILNYATS